MFQFNLDNNNSIGRTLIKDMIASNLDYYYYAKCIIEKSIRSTTIYQLTFLIISLFALILLCLFKMNDAFSHSIKNVFLSILFVYSFFYLFFFKMIEKKQLKSLLDSLNIIINSYH